MADWNINNYRRPHDTDEEWGVMSEFMTAHKSHIPESRLVCLAHVLKNVLFYKCRYPLAVMQQIDSLAKGIKDRFSARRKGLLTRHFVGASDASKQSFEARIERNAQKHQEAVTKKSNLIKSYNFVKSKNEEEEDINKTEAPSQNTGAGENTNSEEEEEFKLESTSVQNPAGFKRKSTEEDVSPSKKLKDLQGIYKPVAFQSSGMQAVISHTQPGQQNPQQSKANDANTRIANNYTQQEEEIYKHLGYIVLYNRTGHMPTQALGWTLDSNCIPYQYVLKDDNECQLFMKGKEIVSLQRKARTKAEIKNALAEEALKILRRKFYTINVKPFTTPAHQISKEDIAKGSDPNAVPESSVGFKLLKMMGWSGGGLGKDETGITEPIRPIKIIGRSGLGKHTSKPKFDAYVKGVINKLATGEAEEDFAFSPEFTKDERARIHMYKTVIGRSELETENQKMEFDAYVNGMINKLANGEVDEDYAFSPEFTKAERAKIHKMASSRKIKSKSYGKGDERFLVLSPKLSPPQLLDKLLKNGDNDRYSVTPPEN